MPCCHRADRDHFEGAQHHALGDFTLPGAAPHYAPDLGLDPQHMELHIQVDIGAKRAEGRSLTTFLARRPDARELTLNAMGPAIHSLADVDGADLSWRHDGKQVHIQWAEPIAAGQTRTLEIKWTVTEPRTGMFFGEGWMATDHETERARHWLPCVDHPNARQSLDIHLTGRTEHVRLATGALVGETDHGDGTTTSHWRLETPCPSYLLCLVSGDFVEANLGTHGKGKGAISHKAYGLAPVTPEDLQRSFGPAVDMMAWMTKRLGVAFPFPKYWQFTCPGIGGAMENITLTSWDDAWVVDETLHAEKGWLVDLINLHEMAHSYFGDAVVIRDYAHAWLKESWATYMESCWLEDVYGIDDLHHQMHEERRAYVSEADESYVRPIVTRDMNSTWQMFDRHLYPGGAWRLHMLRCMLGEDAFWAGVKDYLLTFSGKVVETSDFRAKLEAASGRSLAHFFDQWVHSPGYPKLKASQKHSKGQLVLTIEQTQATPKEKDPKKKVGLFRFDLEVAIEAADGSWTRHTLPMDDKKHALAVPMADAPTQIIVDPESKLMHTLDFDPGDDMLGRALTECPHIYGRIHAAEALAKDGKRERVAAIEAAYANEPHWGVRIAMSRALGAAGTLASASALGRLLGVEADPRCMESLTVAAGTVRDTGVAQQLEDWLAVEGRPYWAQGGAMRSLGSQHDPAHLPTLLAKAEDQGWWGWVRRQAYLGLGQTRSAEAIELLLTRVEPDKEPAQVRQMAVMGLAQAARLADDATRARALDVIAARAHDPVNRVRLSTAAALATLGEAGGLSALSSLEKNVPPQDVPTVQRARARLNKGLAKKRAAHLETQVDELTDKLLKLADRVEQLEATAKASEDTADAQAKGD
jgi:aminopeptidase N